jgi:FAD/FMN-containing dehydrogenase
MAAPLRTELEHLVGRDHVLADASLRAPYEVDWTRRFTGTARFVVRPADVDELAAVVRACTAAGAAVVPQGGNTGLVGGGVPRGGEVVVSTRRLDELGDVDVATGQVTVGAGVTLARLQAHVAASGWSFGVDLAARDSATIGGMIATNAGGLHVLRHGSMRAQVVDVEAVTATGAVIGGVRGLVKDNTGYHLPSLLAGSEGTLAVLARARLRLVPALPARAVALVAVPDLDAAVSLLAAVRPLVPSLEAAEVFLAEGLDLVCSHTGVPRPFAPDAGRAFLLLACAGLEDPTDELGAALAETVGVADASGVAGASGVPDAIIATEARDRRRLWHLREAHTEAISAQGITHKLDVSVPPDRLAAFVAEAADAVRGLAPDARFFAFGHLAEGNLHVSVLGPDPEDETVDDVLNDLVLAAGGSISAEHGIGFAKASWLSRIHSPAHLAALRGIKRAFDPDGLLNPGVLVDP